MWLRSQLTRDEGEEMAEQVRFSVESGMSVHFRDPRNPWRRGNSEKANGPLRQYFAKGTDLLPAHSQNDLNAVARQLSGCP